MHLTILKTLPTRDGHKSTRPSITDVLTKLNHNTLVSFSSTTNWAIYQILVQVIVSLSLRILLFWSNCNVTSEIVPMTRFYELVLSFKSTPTNVISFLKRELVTAAYQHSKWGMYLSNPVKLDPLTNIITTKDVWTRESRSATGVTYAEALQISKALLLKAVDMI